MGNFENSAVPSLAHLVLMPLGATFASVCLFFPWILCFYLCASPQPPQPKTPEVPWAESDSAVFHLTDQTFDSFLEDHPAALVMFYAPCEYRDEFGHFLTSSYHWTKTSSSWTCPVTREREAAKWRKNLSMFDLSEYDPMMQYNLQKATKTASLLFLMLIAVSESGPSSIFCPSRLKIVLILLTTFLSLFASFLESEHTGSPLIEFVSFCLFSLSVMIVNARQKIEWFCLFVHVGAAAVFCSHWAHWLDLNLVTGGFKAPSSQSDLLMMRNRPSSFTQMHYKYFSPVATWGTAAKQKVYAQKSFFFPTDFKTCD